LTRAVFFRPNLRGSDVSLDGRALSRGHTLNPAERLAQLLVRVIADPQMSAHEETRSEPRAGVFASGGAINAKKVTPKTGGSHSP